MEPLATAIAAVVGGDLNYLAAVTAASHLALGNAAEELPPLFVTRVAVAKVLEDWLHGLFSAEDVRKWASFVRRGYVSGGSGKIRPIQIDYDAQHEEMISEIIGRLDEIGDQVDGCIETHEVELMLRDLAACVIS